MAMEEGQGELARLRLGEMGVSHTPCRDEPIGQECRPSLISSLEKLLRPLLHDLHQQRLSHWCLAFARTSQPGALRQLQVGQLQLDLSVLADPLQALERLARSLGSLMQEVVKRHEGRGVLSPLASEKALSSSQVWAALSIVTRSALATLLVATLVHVAFQSSRILVVKMPAGLNVPMAMNKLTRVLTRFLVARSGVGPVGCVRPLRLKMVRLGARTKAGPLAGPSATWAAAWRSPSSTDART